MNKVILIDSASLFFRTVFNYERMMMNKKEGDFILPPVYVYFTSIISALKKIGITKEDKIILALEGKSWRKSFLSSYKAQRQEEREKHTLINWDKEFKSLNDFHDKLEKATPFHLIRDWKSEADDIISTACRYYKDNEIIIVSSDGDLKQLTYYPWVKFFTVSKKCNGSNGLYEVVNDPLKIISDKVKKGDKSDNIIPSPNDTDEDIELRHFIVNLLELPEYIENTIKEKLNNLSEKESNLDLLPFKNAKEKFLKIYDKDKIITYDYCKNLIEKRKNRRKK